MRVRVKICGITRREDALAAARAGADAIGLVFYPPSPRCLSLAQARALRSALPPFVTAVALFVNPAREEVERVLAEVRPDALQFHGEEDPAFCRQFGVPYIKACRIREGTDLLKYCAPFTDAQGWLADAYVEAYGGVGARFDWRLVPAVRDRPLILSGGLSVANVGEALRVVKPWGVDVSTGVEVAKGIKDATMIEAFIAEVHNAAV
jgi:phosphoribosylanthranilate isomerase